MARVLIFAKGGKALDPARYRTPDDRVVETRFPEHVARQWFAPGGIDRAFALLTDRAEEAWGELLQTAWPDTVKPEPVRIPETATEEDLWTIFQTIGDCVSAGDEVVLDITNGFRSIPLVAMLAVTYIRVVKRARLMGLGYGAFEAKDAAGVSPYQDLTAMARLLDWTSAVEAFETHGDGKALGALIRELKASIYRRGGKVALADRPVALDRLSTHVRDFALGLETLRHEQVSRSASGLQMALRESLESEADARLVRPMMLLANRVEEVTAPFISAGSPGLAQQEAMLGWLREREIWLPYLALLHEHLAEHLAAAFGFEDGIGSRSTTMRHVHAWCDHLLGAVDPYRRVKSGEWASGELRAYKLPDPVRDRGGVEEDAPDGWDTFARLARTPMANQMAAFADVELNRATIELSRRVRDLRNALMHGGLGKEEGSASSEKLTATIREFHQAFIDLQRPLFQVDRSTWLLGHGQI